MTQRSTVQRYTQLAAGQEAVESCMLESVAEHLNGVFVCVCALVRACVCAHHRRNSIIFIFKFTACRSIAAINQCKRARLSTHPRAFGCFCHHVCSYEHPPALELPSNHLA